MNHSNSPALAALIACSLGGTAFSLEHATLDVTQRNNTNNNQASADPAVAVSIGLGNSRNFSVVGHNDGDIDVSFTSNRANERNLGVVINSIAELARQNGVLPNKGGPATTVYPNGVAYGTAGAEPSGTGYYLSNNVTLGGAESASPFNSELNIDVAAAWFPHTEGWLAGHYKTTATLYSSSAIRLGKEFVRDGSGVSVVDLRHLRSHGVAATSQNGVLLVSGGDNAGLVAMARPNLDGTFTVSTKSNSTTTPLYNDAGVAFVYVPLVSAGMGQVMAVGKVRSDGSKALAGGDFTVTKLATGRWLVKIGPEGSEFINEDGTLVISAEGGSPVAGATPTPKNRNNFVAHGWSQADGGWIVESRDNIAAELEDGATPAEEMFSFVFLTPGDPENLFSYENAPLPEVSLSSPVENSYHTVGQPVTLATSVAAAGNVEIAKVDFYVDSVLVGSATSAPYEIPWAVAGTGTHLVEAFAYTTDNAVAGAKRVWFYGTVPIGDVSVPGYSAAILDGGDLETDVTELDVDYVPSPTTPWNILANSPGSQAFGTAGDVRGAPAVNIGGAPVPFNSGILFATNFLSNTFHEIPTRGSVDNNVIAYNATGNIALKVEDNKQGGSLVRPESGRFAMGFFPYSSGWVGASLAADGSIVDGSSSLPAGVTITKSSSGTDFVIEGLPMTGNLLAVSQGAASDNVVCIGRNANTWIIRSVDNNGAAESDSTSFLYVPTDAPQVLSGLVQNDATLVPLNETMAAHGARVVRTGVGYEIEFGDGSKINPSNTVLLVTADVNNGDGGDNVFAYHTRGNKFVVFSHDLPGINGFFQNGGFRFLAVPTAPLANPGQQVFVTHVVDKVQEGVEGDDTLTYRFSRLGGDSSQPLTVNYTLSGTATAGTDYVAPSGTVTFAAGVTEVEVPIVTLNDETLELRETVVVTLSEGAGFSVGSGTASGTIRNVGTNPAIQTVSFQQGVNGYNSYFGKRVGTGSVNQMDSPSVQTYGVDGSTDNTTDINGILRFDSMFGTGSGKIPYGSTIVKAELTIATGSAGSDTSGGPWVIDRLKGVVTSVTTYENLTNGSNVGVRGRSALTPLAGFAGLALGDIDTVDVTKFVRIWVNVQNNESEDYNHGFSLYDADTDDAWGYCTSGNSDPNLRPKLVVSYIPPTPDVETNSYSFDASKSVKLRGTGTSLDGAQLQGNYIDLEPSPGTTEEALFQFPVEFGAGAQAIPADEDIVRAELVLTSVSGGNSASPGPVAVHRMLEDWMIESNYGYYGPEVGAQLDIAEDARVFGLGHGSIATFDVTAIVRAWRAGAGQHGINVKPETTDGWQFFWPGASGADATKVPKLVIYTAKSIGVESGFEAWATANGIGGATQDFDGDHDGIPALIEYALGLDPEAFDKLPGLQAEGGGTVLRFLKGAPDNRLVYKIKSSIDLDVWGDVTPTVDNANEISAIVTIGEDDVRFYRLSVTYTEG
ncbi:Ig-like domain-containing protein [Luteolibacter arcticus]|uniref:Ig-like domain-containing protein n=1 Tax=Luteolibacter arcticus TaxID=1581411 RepID=A0ABT3GFX9_9BACT|nr:Ig-like domain-containing protein [Luteolibacter arcticus]MCW1922527.1 Ig-like domain-containing protein [Luteolibacter arcticus]